MLIDGHTIAEMIDSGAWKAYRDEEPIKSKDLVIGSNSLDITLGKKMLRPIGLSDKWPQAIDPVDYKDNLRWEEIPSVDDKFFIHPGNFLLATVRERFDVSAPVRINFEQPVPRGLELYAAPMFEGKSTMARLGLAMHVTAGLGHYGFDGHFTMELVNHGPLLLVLTVGMRIAQLSFQAVTPGVAKTRYCGAYANQNGGPNPPVLGRDRFMQQPVT